MFRPSRLCALAAILAAPAASLAASESFSSTFDFSLSEGPDDHYTGNTSVSLNQFDTQGGVRVLDEVRLHLNEMTFTGSIVVYDVPFELAAIDNGLGDTYAEIEGSASAGPLLIEEEAEEAGTAGFILVDETLTGSDSATSGLEDFIGRDSVLVSLFGSVEAYYNVQAGAAPRGISVEGKVELEYIFHVNGVTPPPPNGVIPTPAAAGLGLAMLGGVIARRRR